MHILSVNPGSTSWKFGVFDEKLERLMGCQIDIREHAYHCVSTDQKGHTKEEVFQDAYGAPIHLLFQKTKQFHPDIIVVRVVHGGERYRAPVKVNEEVIWGIDRLGQLAPLHNPISAQLIQDLVKYGNVPVYAVFDTAFHSTLPAYAYQYALPHNFYTDFGVRRYGFHGISHQYVSARLLTHLPQAKKIISLHLGGGASITAIQEGRSIETSMGFSPTEGLIMASRSGDVDISVAWYLEQKGITLKHLSDACNKSGGLKWLTGTSDMREVLERAGEWDPDCLRARDMYVYRIQKYIGAYMAVLGGLDALVFTGGVGCGSALIRSLVLQPFGFLWVELDTEANTKPHSQGEFCISTSASRIACWVIATDEEKQMAQEILHLVQKN